MLGSGVAITMYYVLTAGLRAVLERCLLLFSMLGLPDFVRAGLGSGWAFRQFFACMYSTDQSSSFTH